MKMTEGHFFSHEMNIQLDMFRPSMMNRIRRQIDCRDVVAKDHISLVDRIGELSEKLAKPTALSHRISNIAILSFRARARDGRLALGGPGHQTVTKVHVVPRSRPPSVWAPGPVGIRVSSQASRGRALDDEAMSSGAMDVAQKPFDKTPMAITGSMHVEAYLTNRIRYVGSGQCEVP
jgi:hypothetical protein